MRDASTRVTAVHADAETQKPPSAGRHRALEPARLAILISLDPTQRAVCPIFRGAAASDGEPTYASPRDRPALLGTAQGAPAQHAVAGWLAKHGSHAAARKVRVDCLMSLTFPKIVSYLLFALKISPALLSRARVSTFRRVFPIDLCLVSCSIPGIPVVLL